MTYMSTSPTSTATLFHVAAVGENRGRVILAMRRIEPRDDAVKLAFSIAELFEASVEALFIEEPDLFAAARLSFAREIRLDGKRRGPLDEVTLSADCEAMASAALTHAARLASISNIACVRRRVRSPLARAIGFACVESGPWNVVVVADPLDAGGSATIGEILATRATTALIAYGPNGLSVPGTSGPVLACLSDPERLHGILKVARRLTDLGLSPYRAPQLALLASTDAELEALETTVRISLADIQSDARVIAATCSVADVAEVIENRRPATLITTAESDLESPQWLAAMLERAPGPVMVLS